MAGRAISPSPENLLSALVIDLPIGISDICRDFLA
jgi:hypothetical protein